MNPHTNDEGPLYDVCFGSIAQHRHLPNIKLFTIAHRMPERNLSNTCTSSLKREFSYRRSRYVLATLSRPKFQATHQSTLQRKVMTISNAFQWKLDSNSFISASSTFTLLVASQPALLLEREWTHDQYLPKIRMHFESIVYSIPPKYSSYWHDKRPNRMIEQRQEPMFSSHDSFMSVHQHK